MRDAFIMCTRATCALFQRQFILPFFTPLDVDGGGGDGGGNRFLCMPTIAVVV